MMQARDDELLAYPVQRYVAEAQSFVETQKFTSKEVYLDITLNGEFLTTAYCSPGDHAASLSTRLR